MELNPSTTAVIAVHMQHDIVPADGAFGGFFAAQAAERRRRRRHREAARRGPRRRRDRRLHPRRLAARLPRPGRQLAAARHGRTVRSAWSRAATRPRSSRSSRRQDGDLVVTHQRVGGFSASQLDVLLRSRGIDTVLFAGVATNASVEGTARQASDLGYRTVIVSDACSAADDGHPRRLPGLARACSPRSPPAPRSSPRCGAAGERMTSRHRRSRHPVWVALSATPHAIATSRSGRGAPACLQAGQADGEPLVLMAGTGGHLEAYAHNIAAFAEPYRVIAYDYPGHGYTTHATADLELPDYVEHLDRPARRPRHRPRPTSTVSRLAAGSP